MQVDLLSTDEVAMLSYIGKNVIKCTRAQDEYMLDWSNVTFKEADSTGKQHAGATYKNQSTKNNKAQEDRTKAITCTDGCKGACSARGRNSTQREPTATDVQGDAVCTQVRLSVTSRES